MDVRIDANVKDPPPVESLSTCKLYGMDVGNDATVKDLPTGVDKCKMCEVDVGCGVIAKDLSDGGEVCNISFVPPAPSLVQPPKGRNICNWPPSHHTPSFPISFVHKKDTGKEKFKSPHITQEGLLNLSKHELSPAEISLHKKGLSFVPSPLKIPQLNYENALEKLRRKYKSRFSLPNRSQRLIDCTLKLLDMTYPTQRLYSPYLTLLERRD